MFYNRQNKHQHQIQQTETVKLTYPKYILIQDVVNFWTEGRCTWQPDIVLWQGWWCQNFWSPGRKKANNINITTNERNSFRLVSQGHSKCLRPWNTQIHDRRKKRLAQFCLCILSQGTAARQLMLGMCWSWRVLLLSKALSVILSRFRNRNSFMLCWYW